MARTALLILLVVASALARTVPQQKNRNREFRLTGQCSNRDSVLEAGQSYEYQYSGRAEVGVGYGDAKTVGVGFDCKIQVAVPQPCQYTLKVQSCEVLEREGMDQSPDFPTLDEELEYLSRRPADRQQWQPSEQSQELTRVLAQYPIQAYASNGQIEQVLYNEQEPVWAVNMKKAMLAAVHLKKDITQQQPQSRHSMHLEPSVHGLCPTRYSTHGQSNKVVVKKDLTACIQSPRPQYSMMNPLAAFINTSTIAPLFMKAQSQCIYTLAQSAIEVMVCREVHSLFPVPILRGNLSAADANVTQTLKLINRSAQSQLMNVNLQGQATTSIIYEHEEQSQREQRCEQAEISQVLEDLLSDVKDEIELGTPAKFNKLIDKMRQCPTLEAVTRQMSRGSADEKDAAKYVIVQALIQCGTPACTSAFASLLNAQELPRAIFEPILFAMSLNQVGSPVFLTELTRVCQERPSRVCAMTIAALTNKLATDNEELIQEPEYQEPIRRAAEFVIGLLDESTCQASGHLARLEYEDEATKTIIALKAIANLGQMPQVQAFQAQNNVEQKLLNCVTNKQLPTNVSVAAVAALQRQEPLERATTDRLFTVLSDQERDPVLRMVICMRTLHTVSDQNTIRNILKLIDTEKNEQVKSFMVSHIKGMMSSDVPHHKMIARTIKQVIQERGRPLPQTRARFPQSAYFEISKFFKAPISGLQHNGEFGGQIETSILFAEDSHVPRFWNLNVTGASFSKYVQLLEVDVDMKNVDELISSIYNYRARGSFAFLNGLKEKVKRTVKSVVKQVVRVKSARAILAKVFEVAQGLEPEQMVNAIFAKLDNYNYGNLIDLLSQMKQVNIADVINAVAKMLPQNSDLQRMTYELRNLRLDQMDAEKIIDILKTLGFSEFKVRFVLRKMNEAGIDVDAALRQLQNFNVERLIEKLKNLRVDDLSEKLEWFRKTLVNMLNWITEALELPNVQQLYSKAKDHWNDDESYFAKGKKYVQKWAEQSENDDDEDEDDDSESTTETYGRHQRSTTPQRRQYNARSTTDATNDNDDSTRYGQNNMNKKLRKQQPYGRMSGRTSFGSDNDSDDVELVACIKMLGYELGFLSINDIKSLPIFSVKDLVRYFKDVVDGFEKQPTLALKLEASHPTVTALGIPLKYSLNLTTIASLRMHLNVQNNEGIHGQTKIAMKLEPSGIVQLTGGIIVDIPSIHTIAVISNTTVKSEFEYKMKLAKTKDTIEIEIEKPDEELDLLYFNNEMKLSKDEEDYEIFEKQSVRSMETEKCLPSIVERITGIKACAELEYSTLRGSVLPSGGPYKARLYIESSDSEGLKHYRFTGRHETYQQEPFFDQQNKQQHPRSEAHRLHMNFEAPGHRSNRNVNSQLTYNHNRKQLNWDLHSPEAQTPRIKFFIHNMTTEENIFGFESGWDVEYAEGKHVNASVTIVADAESYRPHGGRYMGDALNDFQFNYTIVGSVQSPQIGVNVSWTAAKVENDLFMENNITYYFDRNYMPQSLRNQYWTDDAPSVKRLTVRYGVEYENEREAFDYQAYAKLITFVEEEPLEVANHVTQVRVNKDLRWFGLFMNTTWLNSEEQLEFFNVTLSVLNTTRHGSPDRLMAYVYNVTRNDWSAALDARVRSTPQDYSIKHRLVLSGMMPQTDSLIEALTTRAIADIKSVVSIIRPRTTTAHASRQWPGRFNQRSEENYQNSNEYSGRQGSARRPDMDDQQNPMGRQSSDGQYRPTSNDQYRPAASHQRGAASFGRHLRSQQQQAFRPMSQWMYDTDMRYKTLVITLENTVKQRSHGHGQQSQYEWSDKDEFDQEWNSGRSDPFEENWTGADEEQNEIRQQSSRGRHTTTTTDRTDQWSSIRKDSKRISAARNSRYNSNLSMRDWDCETCTKELSTKLEFPWKGQRHYVRAITLVGMNQKDRNALLSLWTQTNVTTSFVEYAAGQATHLIISKHEGLQVYSNATVQKRQQQMVGLEGRFVFNPINAQIVMEASVDTPRFDAEIKTRVSKPQNAILDFQWTSESQSQMASQWLTHNLRYDAKIEKNGAITKNVQFQHPKVQMTAQMSGQLFGQGAQPWSSQSEEEGPSRLRTDLRRSTYTYGAMKNLFKSIQPRINGQIRINSQDPEVFPTLSAQAQLSTRRASIDVDIQQVPRILKDLIPTKKYEASAEVAGDKILIQVTLPQGLYSTQRGQLSWESELKNQRSARSRLYDTGLFSDGETTHAEATVDLDSDSSFRPSLYVNPHMATKMAEVSRKQARKAYEAAKHHGRRAFEEAGRAWSDDEHQLYKYLKPYYTGSAQDFVQDRVAQAARFYKNQYADCDMDCEREDSNENPWASYSGSDSGRCPPIGSASASGRGRSQQLTCSNDEECQGRDTKCCPTANGKQCIPVPSQQQSGSRRQSCAIKSAYCNKSVFGFSAQQLFEILKINVKRLVREVKNYAKDTPAGEWIALIPDFEEVKQQVYQSMERHSGPQMRIIKDHIKRMSLSEPFESAEAAKDMLVRLYQTPNARLSQLAIDSVEVAKDFLQAVLTSIQRRIQNSPTLARVIEPDTFDLIRQNIDLIEVPALEDVDDVLMSAFGMLKAALFRQIKTVGQVENGKLTFQIPHPLKWNNIKSFPQLKDEHREYGKNLWTRSVQYYQDFKRNGQLPFELFGRNNSRDLYNMDEWDESESGEQTEDHRSGSSQQRSRSNGQSSDEQTESFRGSQVDSQRHRGRTTPTTTQPSHRFTGRYAGQSQDYMTGRAQSNDYMSGRRNKDNKY